jgi:hypothetical protein
VFIVASTTFPETGRLAGLMTLGELTGAGFSRRSIRELLSRGDLIRVRRGAYARAGLTAQDPEAARTLAMAAAVAVAGPDAVASHQAVAQLHGLALLGRPDASPISVSVPSGRSALYQHKTTKADLVRVIDACRFWPGNELARRVLAFSTDLAESPFESVARVAFDEAGLPPPELQVWVGDDRPIARVDFLWREHRTIAEADGALKYADPDRARQQLQRDAELRDAGFEVVHFPWREMMVNPAQVVERITAAFGRASMFRTAG